MMLLPMRYSVICLEVLPKVCDAKKILANLKVLGPLWPNEKAKNGLRPLTVRVY